METNKPHRRSVWPATNIGPMATRITVPFTAEPGCRPIVISRGDPCLDAIDHKPEAYRLAAGIHVTQVPADKQTALITFAGAVLNRLDSGSSRSKR